MKLITVEDLKEGDVLANDVLLDDYTVVIAKGTVIKKQYIDKLRELDIFTVYIEDNDDDVSRETISEKPQKEQKTEEKTEEQPEPKKEVEPKKKAEPKRTPKIAMEQITILRDDVKDKVKDKIKDILELHIYQDNEGLKELTDAAQTIITDILEEDEVVEKVYDVRERSADIYEHCLQVCTISTLIGLKLGMSNEEVNDISVGSLIHDLGLRYLIVKYEDQDIHFLPAKEQEEYKKHTVYGYTAIKGEEWLSENAKDIMLNHHERLDGSGYPLGVKKMPRTTQIVAVCDEFDELICGIGKARVRVHEAINNIRNYSGIWFDADIVAAFLQLIAVYPVGSKVRTNKGEIGLVMRQNFHFPERPVIRIMQDEYGQVVLEEKIIDLIKDTTVVIQEVVK